MNDRALLELLRRVDPVTEVDAPPHGLLERVLADARTERTSPRLRGWQARFALVAVAFGVSAVIASLAIAGTGWLTGSPAPRSVKSDFGSYATQLGFDPRPGKAVLVASDGDYQLYATANEQGGFCTLVSAPWKRPGPNGEGGDCVANPPDATAFWAGIGGMSSEPNDATILVIEGHTTDKGAASVRFEAPDGTTVTAPVGSGGFFIVGTPPVHGSLCDWGTWAPRFTVLDSSGNQLGATTVTIFPGARKITIPGGGHICAAMSKGPYGP
jgi:hypothetical protein